MSVLRSNKLVVIAALLFVASWVLVPLGILAFAFENELHPPGHGAAGWGVLTLSFACPLAAGVAIQLALGHRNRAASAMVVGLLIMGAAWAVLARLIVHYGVR